MKTNELKFPFTAVVGQKDFKLSLLLNLIDPTIGGVLVVGDKGTGKTTLIRSLTTLMSKAEVFPFVNLPIGASEDRVLGHISLEKLINEKKEQVVPGLLAKADKGCLYIDEINLLNDYLMDSLLDAAASGGYFLEREGISKYLESQFCLIGSMNPEEGELRPQLKDRFGLSVTVKTNTNATERFQIIQNRIAFDDDAKSFVKKYIEDEDLVYTSILKAKLIVSKVEVPTSIYEAVTTLVLQHQVEGHRADILLIKTARAYAAYLGETEVTLSHLDKIKDFVLDHRSNNQEEPPSSDDNSQQKEEEEQENKEEQKEQELSTFESILPENNNKKLELESALNSKKGENSKVNVDGARILEKGNSKVDFKKTVSQYIATDSFELHHKQQIQKSQKHLIFVLDSSGSMLIDKVVAYAKGMVQKIAEEEKVNKPLFSLVSISNGESQILAREERQIEVFVDELNQIKTGGKTNIVPAFRMVKELIQQKNRDHNELILVTDGKFNSEEGNAFEAAVLGFKMYCKAIKTKKVIDAERGIVKLALAEKFASKINASYEKLVY